MKNLQILLLFFCATVLLGANAAKEPLLLVNPDFEEVTPNGMPLGWTWWQREGKGSATLVDDAHHGKRALHIVQRESNLDFACTNGRMLPVPAGGEYIITAWLKVNYGGGIEVSVVAYDQNKERITWMLGATEDPKRVAESEWQRVMGYVQIPDDCKFVQFRLTGGSKLDVVIDDITVVPGSEADMPQPPKSKPVVGWATSPVVEKFGRGVFAQRTMEGVYVSWRLLVEDKPDTGFDVYRVLDGQRVKLNALPIRQTCDWLDQGDVPAGVQYEVTPAAATAPGARATVQEILPGGEMACQVFKLSDPKARAGKVGIVDLNGDGVYDYVVQHPGSSVDPWHVYWRKSEHTYKIDAFLGDGTRLWTFDRGWSIENGIWYSPFVAADVTGDGRAEVVLKVADGDLRNEKGMVEGGEEWFAVLDGMTGKEIARAPWPDRDGFGDYNYYCRNQLAVARLDGKTPCIVALRGTYTVMKAEAWMLRDGKMVALWKYDSRNYSRKYRGQGAHTTLVLDIDNDSRDEIILGSAVIDDNGDPLWTTGKGHPDGVYYGDIIPSRPGMEIAYVMETSQSKDGLCVVDALTGKVIWGLQERTSHVHGSGVCADIDCLHPGVELAGTNADGHKLTDNRWMFSGDGQLLLKGADMPYGFAATTVYWDADLQSEICRGKILDHAGGPAGGSVTGSVIQVADVVGDWREEIMTSTAGEFRIYSTAIPAMDRRPCLMQDYGYRMRQHTNAMGYTSGALLASLPSATSPNLNLTYQHDERRLRVVVTAPQAATLRGSLKILPLEGVKLNKTAFDVELKPAGVFVDYVTVSNMEEGFTGCVKAELTLASGTVLRGQVPVRFPVGKLANAVVAEAEKPFAQTGGEVQVRSDKKDVQGKAISHWDNVGHALTYKLNIKDAGKYTLAVRYCSNNGAWRTVAVDGKPVGKFFFYSTGGLGDNASDWDHFFPVLNGIRLVLDLKQGEHTITLTNADGAPCNLDYVAFVKK